LLLDHLLSVLASALFVGFLGAWEFGVVTTICAVVSIGCALLIPYHDSWKIGVSDGNTLKREGKDASKLRGIIAGLLATIPSFAVAIIACFCSVSGLSIGLVMDQSVAEVLYRVWFFPFSSLFPYLEQFPWIYFLPLAVLPVSAGVGYYFGRSKLLLRDYLYYRRGKDTTK